MKRDAAPVAPREAAAVILHILPVSVLVVLCVWFPIFSAHAQATQGSHSPQHLRQLVKKAVKNEVNALKHPAHRYKYQQREETSQGSKTSAEIELRKGTLERLIKVNGKPPTEKQCRKSRTQLQRLASNARAQQALFKGQQDDLNRREKLLSYLPKAFRYHYEGTDQGNGWLKLGFRPDPDFDPDSRVAGVLVGMEGTLWLDPSNERLMRIQGRLFKNVTFGWGFLAKLNAGGHYRLEQTKLPDGAVHLSMLGVHFHGTELIFKKLNVDLKDTYSGFKKVPDTLTVQQAVSMLENIPVHCTP